MMFRKNYPYTTISTFGLIASLLLISPSMATQKQNFDKVFDELSTSLVPGSQHKPKAKATKPRRTKKTLKRTAPVLVESVDSDNDILSGTKFYLDIEAVGANAPGDNQVK